MDILSKKWHILAIDDSKLNRSIIKRALSQLNMSVDEAEDGLDGLQALERVQYDLVLVDLVMPNLDGFGFLARFKTFTGKKFIPVILITGMDDLNSKIKGLRIGADDFLMKPLNEKELVARVLSLLRLKSAHDELFEKNELIKRELETAKKVQEFIIPKDFSHVSYPKVSGRYLPTEDIGGDYFDCFSLPNERYGFLIADVTGHGIPAALVMSMSRMIFSIYAPRASTTGELLKIINSQMRGLLLDYQYITCFYAIYNGNERKVQISNAGHAMPLFYRASTKKVLALDTFGWFIGISDDVEYENKSVKVEEGDRLLLYTDGITEIKNADKEDFGEKRLAAFIRENNNIKGEYFCEALLKEVNSFCPLEKRSDDIAFLNIEF